jgi:PPM family protein phosphatase
MRLAIAAVCDRGPTRENNEDMVLVGDLVFRDSQLSGVKDLDDPSMTFAVAVADGLGGANAGERASYLVLEMLRDGLTRIPCGLDDAGFRSAMTALCTSIHLAVLQEGRADPARAGMGSTLVGLVHYGGRLRYVSAGDSRLYRLRDATLMQISTDHTLLPDDRSRDRLGTMITNSFGGGTEFHLEAGPAAGVLAPDDVFLLCSDGLSDTVDEDEIERLLGTEDAASCLLSAAVRNGGHDNISYVIVKVSDLDPN